MDFLEQIKKMKFGKICLQKHFRAQFLCANEPIAPKDKFVATPLLMKLEAYHMRQICDLILALCRKVTE